MHDVVQGFDCVVIPCSSVKLPYAAPARQLYCGKGLYTLQLRFADLTGLPFYIMSTKYGLIQPHKVIEPYNLIWSKKLQQDNKGMRGKVIPIATQQHREVIARKARLKLDGSKVLCLCSLNYELYFPHWYFFNRIIGEGRPINNRGIQLIMGTLNNLTKGKRSA